METQSPQLTLLRIDGMSCAGCVRSVETALDSVPGVTLATVNFAGQTAAVTGTDNITDLIDAVQAVGYEASLFRDESVDHQELEAGLVLRRAMVKSALALIAALILMADMWLGLLPPLAEQSIWLTIGVATLVLMVYCGGQFYKGAWNALRHYSTTMDTLIALGTGTAWLYSMLVLLVPGLIPVQSHHQFFEAALFIIGFVGLGKALELNARTRSSLAIRKLFDMTPAYATLIGEAGDSLVPLEEIAAGQSVRIKPGENIPVDGKVLDGITTTNESMLTGESELVVKTYGSLVYAGTLNVEGSVVVEVNEVGESTRLAGISRLVSAAQNSKPAVAVLVDQITAVFVPIVLGLAVLTAALWLWLGPEPQLSYAIVTAMSVLIVACPCALGLAVPMSIMIGLGQAAKKGLLISNSNVLQMASKLDVMVLDKTGTLTMGKPDIVDSSGLTEQHLMQVHGLEIFSSHPLAQAIVQYCQGRNIAASDVSSFKNHVGGGVTGEADGRRLILGSPGFLKSQGIRNVPEIDAIGTIVSLGMDDQFIGYLLLQDKVRPETKAILQSLIKRGIQPIMLTGDREQVAKQVAAQVGIDEYHAEVSPDEKLIIIESLQSVGRCVGMVGDGINDAAALAQANVGFAMGLGTDIARESADVTLQGDSLNGIESTIKVSVKVLRNMHQNLFAAFAYNIVLIPVAAGLLYPSFNLLIDPALAGLAMALSSVTVVLNAGRLRSI